MDKLDIVKVEDLVIGYGTLFKRGFIHAEMALKINELIDKINELEKALKDKENKL